MSIVNRTVGAATPTGAGFVVRATTGSVRVAVADNDAMVGPVFTASQARDAGGAAKIAITGLDPSTRYWWQAEDGAGLDTGTTGTFLTHPPIGEPASFTFGIAGDAGLNPHFPGSVGGELDAARVSDTPTWQLIHDRAIAENWLFYGNHGDWGYPDWGTSTTDTVTNRRRFYDDNLAQPNQAPLCRDVPQVYLWDDHDFAGNDSNGTYANKSIGAQVYRERCHHYPLASGSGPIYHSFQIARTLFLAADVRYNRSPNGNPDNASKTMLGAAQKTWMESTLTAAAADDGIVSLIWLMPDQWLGTQTDSWNSFQTERAELVEMFGDTGWLDRMCYIGADSHDSYMLTADAVHLTTGLAAHFPGYHFAAVDATPIYGPVSDVGTGAMSLVNNRRGRGQYGSMHVGDTGAGISISGTAWRGQTRLMRHQFNTGGSTPLPAGPPSHVIAL